MSNDMWTQLQDNEVAPEHLDVLTNLVDAMKEQGAGTVTVLGDDEDDHLLMAYGVAKVGGFLRPQYVGFHFDVPAGSIRWVTT